MGLSVVGSPLSWDETEKLAKYVSELGIKQFINIYRRWKNRSGDTFKWGDEVEHILVKFDNANKVARLSLCSDKFLTVLNQREEENPDEVKSLWRSEVGHFMLESSPGQPYEGLLEYINKVEANMKYRRHEIEELLADDESMMTLTNFPRLGAPDFTWPIYKPQPNKEDSVNRSLYFPDEAIFPYRASYNAMTKNIRLRRGDKVNINLTIFKDKNTKIPVEGAPAEQPDAVYMDAIGFGFGCCCLQVTFQAHDLPEACTLYDQLGAFCPIMLALTAAAPAFRGYLVDSDTRWNVLNGSADCRTPEERGEAPLKDKKYRIPTTRYSSIDSYVSAGSARYNDVPLVYDERMLEKLRDGGVDELMAQHIANLFIRDPLFLYNEYVHQNDEDDTYHFDCVHVVNWRSMRLKRPSADPDCGWRVEFRPCEIQMTDFENAAIACFIALLTRVIISYKLNFLIPISKVNENIDNAQKRDACHKGRFWFRKNIFNKPSMNGDGGGGKENGKSITDEYELMTLNEIFNGNGSSFPGLIPLVDKYMSTMDVDINTYRKMQRYLQLIERRASGELLTTASWIRQEIVNHPEYKKDSVVSERINYDLLKKVKEIQEGTRSCPELHGSLYTAAVHDEVRSRGH